MEAGEAVFGHEVLICGGAIRRVTSERTCPVSLLEEPLSWKVALIGSSIHHGSAEDETFVGRGIAVMPNAFSTRLAEHGQAQHG